MLPWRDEWNMLQHARPFLKDFRLLDRSLTSIKFLSNYFFLPTSSSMFLTGRSNDYNIFTKHSVTSKCWDHNTCTQHVETSPKRNSKIGRIFIGFCGRGLFMGKFSSLFLSLCRYYLKTSREIKRMEAISQSPVLAHLADTLEGIIIIRTYHMEDKFMDAFNE